MHVIGRFVRDMSFENIAARSETEGEIAPDASVEAALEAGSRKNPDHCALPAKYAATSGRKGTGDALFPLGPDCAGAFLIESATGERPGPIPLIDGARMTFPFARRIVGDVARDGEFPPLNIENVDFVSPYRRRLERRKNAAQVEADGRPNPDAGKPQPGIPRRNRAISPRIFPPGPMKQGKRE